MAAMAVLLLSSTGLHTATTTSSTTSLSSPCSGGATLPRASSLRDHGPHHGHHRLHRAGAPPSEPPCARHGSPLQRHPQLLQGRRGESSPGTHVFSDVTRGPLLARCRPQTMKDEYEQYLGECLSHPISRAWDARDPEWGAVSVPRWSVFFAL
jgi:hypothetical protein